MKRVKIGIVGIGTISGIYLKNVFGMFKDIIEVVAYSDLIPERAQKAADTYGGRACKDNEELFNMDEIELVVNLTTPDAHALVNLGALRHGKCAYTEKPHSITREEGREILAVAKENGLLVGGAPDTFLGGGIQTCRKLIEDGWIGKPLSAVAFMNGHGHESWHPAPEFYYKTGAGPMFDMGPYYLTALINLLGPIADVAGSAGMGFKQRTITSEPLYGTVVDVEVPTHVTGLINFTSGAQGMILTSFDMWGGDLPRIEIYGTEGTISVPDPNVFYDTIRYRGKRDSGWSEIPSLFGYKENSRALGVADMCCAIRNKRAPRANGEQTYHVLDAMHGFHDASRDKKNYIMESTMTVQPPLPMGLLDGRIEL